MPEVSAETEVPPLPSHLEEKPRLEETLGQEPRVLFVAEKNRVAFSDAAAAAALRANDKQFGGDHYKRMRLEPWDVIDTWPLEQRIGFYRGNAVKYIMRFDVKEDVDVQLRKAGHYIDKLLEVLAEQK